MNRALRNIRSRSKGSALVVAMLYLMLFSVLGVGFAAASQMSVQTADHDRSMADAQAAAESGAQWALSRLASVRVDSPDPHAAAAVAASALAQAATDFVHVDHDGCLRFRTLICEDGATLRLTVVGQGSDSTLQRTISFQFRIEQGALITVAGTYAEGSL